MSIRTIIEINHDYLHKYREHPGLWDNLLNKILSDDWEGRWVGDAPGIRKVGQRHHSETLKLTIK